MKVVNREAELAMSRVDVEIFVLHIENRELGSMGKRGDNEGEGDHMETDLANKFVQQLEVQDRAEVTPFLQHKEIGGVEAPALVVLWNEFYSALPEEGICFLSEKVRMRSHGRVLPGWAMRWEGGEFN